MRRLRTFISIFLLALFAAYQINTTLFIHSHVIGGIKVVHSHPFNTPHSHTTAELTLISQLSDFHSFEAHGFHYDFTPHLIHSAQQAEYIAVGCSRICADHPSLRAPPSFIIA